MVRTGISKILYTGSSPVGSANFKSLISSKVEQESLKFLVTGSTPVWGSIICLGTRTKGTSSLSRVHTSYVGRFEGTVKACMVEVYPYWLPVERRMDWNESSDVKGSSPFPSTNFNMGCNARKYGGSATKDNHQRHDISSITGQCPEKSVYVGSTPTRRPGTSIISHSLPLTAPAMASSLTRKAVSTVLEGTRHRAQS